MLQSTGSRKAVLALALVAAGAGIMAWQLQSKNTPTAMEIVPISKIPLEELGAASPTDLAILKDAERLLPRGQHAKALHLLGQFEHKDGGLAHLRATLIAGRCHLELGQLREAERTFRYLTDQRPQDPDGYRGLASVYQAFMAHHAQDEALQKVAELDPRDYRALLLRASINNDMKLYEPAEQSARAGLDRVPPPDDRRALRLELAEALLGQKRFQDAIDAIPTETSAQAFAIRAESYRMLSQNAESRAAVEAGLAASPDPKSRVRLLTELGWLQQDAGEDAQAAATFAQVLTLEPFHLAALLQRSQILSRMGEAEQAQELEARFQEASQRLKRLAELTEQVADHPYDAERLKQLAQAYKDMNMPELASMVQRAVEASSSPPSEQP